MLAAVRFAIAAAVALAAATGTARAAGVKIGEGDTFPDLASFNLEGALPDLGSSRVVVVDFWASWCGPCKASFPVFDELHGEFASRGVTIVAVSVDQNAKAMGAFMQRHSPAFAVVRDREQKLAEAVAPPAMPTTYVIDGRGVVRFVHNGFHGDQSRRAFIEQIETLLGETP
jgi:thiol-disulfide isomerase/thioredoxin